MHVHSLRQCCHFGRFYLFSCLLILFLFFFMFTNFVIFFFFFFIHFSSLYSGHFVHSLPVTCSLEWHEAPWLSLLPLTQQEWSISLGVAFSKGGCEAKFYESFAMWEMAIPQKAVMVTVFYFTLTGCCWHKHQTRILLLLV